MANTFKFGNGEWAVGKETALAYNDENNNFKPLPFSFDRASTATVVNKDGLIETVGVDEPRIDFLNNPKGHLLLEPQRRNDIPYSQDFSIANWVAASGATKEYNVATSPDGSQNASRFNYDGTWNGRVEYSSVGGLTSGISYTISVYLKSESGNIENVQIGHDAWGLKSVTVTNEWQRFTQTVTSNSTSAYPRVRLNTAGSILVWGYQLEAGSYATSYIPTSGSSVTRSAERSDATLNSSVLNNVEGTIFVDVDYISTGDVVVIASPHDGAANKRIEIFANGSTINGFIGGSVNINIGSTTISNGRHKIAIAYKSGNSAFYIDGVQIGVSSTAFTISALTKFSFNQYQGTLVALENVKEAKIYNTRLSNSELQALTTI